MKTIHFSCLLAISLLFFAQKTNAEQFWKGADISWVTELEAKNHTFYNFNHQPRDPFLLMNEMGLNAIRLRLWVDPKKHNNWCNLADVIRKAQRAQAANLEIMLDFHYSDWWADPGKQNIPKRWQKCNYQQMRDSVYAYTCDALIQLSNAGIKPRWIQIGNETSNGLLFSVKVNKQGWVVPGPDGKSQILRSVGGASDHPEQYAGLLQAGCQAAHEILPTALRIIHLDNGWNQELYDWNLGILDKYHVDYDIIGMSLYPYWSMLDGSEPTAEKTIDDCIQNIQHCYKRFHRPTIIVETGYAVDPEHPETMQQGREQLQKLLNDAQQLNGLCQGVFYWEPLCLPSVYKLGAFHEDGTPTEIMKAFQ